MNRKGDYYRYLAEFGPENVRHRHGDLSLQAYKVAYKRALATLDPLDPTRLGLALNFSVFYHGNLFRVCSFVEANITSKQMCSRVLLELVILPKARSMMPSRPSIQHTRRCRRRCGIH